MIKIVQWMLLSFARVGGCTSPRQHKSREAGCKFLHTKEVKAGPHSCGQDVLHDHIGESMGTFV